MILLLQGNGRMQVRFPELSGFGFPAERSGPPGMAAAIRLPASKGTLASFGECITSVGTLTCDRSELTSTSPLARKLRTASAGELEIRCSSLNQSACSLVPPGIN